MPKNLAGNAGFEVAAVALSSWMSATAFEIVREAPQQAKALGAEPAASAKAVAQRSTLIDAYAD